MGRGDATSSTVDNIRDENYFKKYDKDTDFEDVDLQQMVLKQQEWTHTSNLGLFVVMVLLWVSLATCLYLFHSKQKRFKN